MRRRFSRSRRKDLFGLFVGVTTFALARFLLETDRHLGEEVFRYDAIVRGPLKHDSSGAEFARADRFAVSPCANIAARTRASELLDWVGLSDRRDYLASQLLGGRKQRVSVARSLMNAPELVLADEPTGNLDHESADRVMELLVEINKTDRTGFLISTHDEKIAARCRRQIHMVDGRGVDDSRQTICSATDLMTALAQPAPRSRASILPLLCFDCYFVNRSHSSAAG